MLGRGSNGKRKLGQTNQWMDHGPMDGPMDGPTDPLTNQQTDSDLKSRMDAAKKNLFRIY